MRATGYENVVSQYYNESTVVSSLLNDCPVFISSVPCTSKTTFDFYHSHAWLLDGCQYYNKTTTKKVMKNGYQQGETQVKEETLLMIHCAFGWEGALCNGYYVSGVLCYILCHL